MNLISRISTMTYDSEDGVLYEPEHWSVWNWILHEIDRWQEVYEGYWGLDPAADTPNLPEEDREFLRSEFRAAQAMLPMIRELSVAGAAQNRAATNVPVEMLKKIRMFFGDRRHSKPVRDAIELALAKETVERLKAVGIAERAFQLAGVLQPRPLSDQAAQYVARVVPLFLSGFDFEVGVMCRAALEAALKDRLFPPDYAVRKTLSGLIVDAANKNILLGREVDPSGGFSSQADSPYEYADRIRETGNFVAHEYPKLGVEPRYFNSPFEVIHGLTKVLEALFPATSS